MESLIPASDAVDDSHTLGHLSLGGPNLTLGRAARIAEPLELYSGNDVRRSPVAVFGQLLGIPHLESRGYHNSPDVQIEKRILLIESDRPRRAVLLT